MKLRDNIDLGPNIILFGDSKCLACIAQFKVLQDYFNEINKPLKVKYYDLSVKEIPSFLYINNKVSTPTWYFPESKNLIQSFIIPTDFVKLMNKSNMKFGNNFDQLAKYGKNFKGENQGFQINNSWQNYLKDKWGNPLDSGTLGRELGPGNVDGIYSKKYYNQPRMLRPGDDLSETLYTNRNCNIMNNPKAKLEMTGLFYDDKVTPDINQFGKKKKKNSFGSNFLYSQMGPAYESGNQFLGLNKYAGGKQNDPIRPNKVENKNLYIGQSTIYNPLNPNYKINTKLGEGTEIILKNNKLSFKN